MDKNAPPVSGTKKPRLKRILLAFLIIFAALQFFQPGKNNQSIDMTYDISTVVPVPDSVHNLLKAACYDCHSNHTNYPWYANIQPVGWWLKNHIDEGKSHINFHEFALVEPKPGSKFNTKQLRQDHKLEEIYEQVEMHEMPLKSYKLLHPEARLTSAQEKMLMDWVVSARRVLMSDTVAVR
jgi:hypothetical protein